MVSEKCLKVANWLGEVVINLSPFDKPHLTSKDNSKSPNARYVIRRLQLQEQQLSVKNARKVNVAAC